MDGSLSGKQRAMIQALHVTRGQIAQAARVAGVSRASHYEWLKQEEYRALCKYKPSKSAMKEALLLEYTQDKAINGYVYLVQCVGTNLYKIGRSKVDYYARLSSLQTGCPYELAMIHAVHCNQYGKLEKVMHKKFEDNCVRGEWFELSESERKIAISMMQREKEMQTVLPL
jgi:hypothetical protein